MLDSTTTWPLVIFVRDGKIRRVGGSVCGLPAHQLCFGWGSGFVLHGYLLNDGMASLSSNSMAIASIEWMQIG